MTQIAKKIPMKVLYKQQGVLIAQTYVNDKSSLSGNMALHVGDDPKLVLARRALLLKSLMPYGIEAISWLNQIHGNAIVEACYQIHASSADALISQKSHHALAIMTADCVPVAIFDERYIGCIHAGWQGLVKGIIPKSVAKLSPKSLNLPKFAYIGACIGRTSYELPYQMAMDIVGQCVQKQWVDMDTQALTQAVITIIDDQKVWFDVGQLASLQLEACGVQVLNQAIHCTYTGQFYSHRQATHHNTQTGRMAMVVARI